MDCNICMGIRLKVVVYISGFAVFAFPIWVCARGGLLRKGEETAALWTAGKGVAGGGCGVG
jgi:hypothetical protein